MSDAGGQGVVAGEGAVKAAVSCGVISSLLGAVDDTVPGRCFGLARIVFGLCVGEAPSLRR